MSHLIVGDGHFCGAPDEAARWTALLARARGAGLRELSILGDFLELWIGLDGLDAPWHAALFDPLRELRGAGVTLRYVWGNKDFFIPEWNARHGLFHEVAERATLPSAAGTLHLEHGDLVNHADRQYRRWRALSRSSPVGSFAKALPRRWLARLAENAARKMQGSNRYHKSYFPETELRARARELPPGPATQIYGHFHTHRELLEGDKRLLTLPFLGAEAAGLWVDETGIRRFETTG